MPICVDGTQGAFAVRSQKSEATEREPPASVGAAESVTPSRTFVPSAGEPSEKAEGAAASARIVTWSLAVPAAGTVTPFRAVTTRRAGRGSGVPVPSNE